ncbi:C1 family peptidase [[Eubacterium] cellulosolvens]
MNEIRSIFSVLILILTLFSVIIQSPGVGVNGDNLSNSDNEIELQLIEDSEMGKSGHNELLAEFSPLEDTRISEYTSHLLTAAEVTELKSKIGVWEPNKNYNILYNGLGTGLAPPTESEWNAVVGKVEMVDSALDADLPDYVNHSTSTYFPPVRSQGGQGSCAAWATTYYTATYLQAKDQGWTQTSSGNNNQILSPAWTFNKVNSGIKKSGSHTWTNYYILADIGGVTWATMPYDDGDFLSWGSVNAWREAPKYRFNGWKWTYPQNIDVIKSWVADGYVVPFAFHAGFYATSLGVGDDTITSKEYNTNSYNHANTIVGYDDNRVTDGEVGAFRIVNSWGSNWGTDWNGSGYYWMTYKAFQELIYPVIMFYDRIDYEPTLLATWNFTGNCSRDSDILLGLGNTSNPYYTRESYFWGGFHNYPAFMCFDVSEFRDAFGLNPIYLEVGDGINKTSISSFKLELYENGYVINNPTIRSGESPEVPKTTPCTVNNTISGYHVEINSPNKNQWYRGVINTSGIANNQIPQTIILEDFENEFPEGWEVGDSNTDLGADYWGQTVARSKNGFRSGWCAANKEPIYNESFDTGSLPSGWTTYSAGPDSYSWDFTNIGYQFIYDGDDHAAFCDSNKSGPGTNITEWLYMTTSFNASEYTELYLEFFLDYSYNNGNEYAQVLYANKSSYPNFYNLRNWTSGVYGWQWLNLSAAAGENEVYLAFRYHGTNDHYMFINELTVVSKNNTGRYENDMDAYFYQNVDLSKYDMVNLTYDYWLDSESGHDGLFVIYYSNGSWKFIDAHSGSSNGWKSASVLIPTNATEVGIHFVSDSSISNYEGAYIDNLQLIGYLNISNVEVRINSDDWNSTFGTTNWNRSIDTTLYSDGIHNFTAKAKYGSNYSYDFTFLNIDNTQPNIFTPTATPSSWTNNTQPVVTFSTTDTTSGISHYQMKIDNGNFFNQTSPFTLPILSEGTHTITVRAYDVVGNYRDATVDVYIDISNPDMFTPTANPSGWTSNTQPVITFGTTDSTSGIDHYEVRIDTGGFSTQGSPYTIPVLDNGTHNITVRAFDYANNYRDASVKVYIDIIKPLPFTPTANPSGWSPVTQPVITFSTTDTTSGIDHYSVKIDTGTFTTQISPYTLPPQSNGIHDVTVRAFDLAGNYAEGTVKVYVDTTLPDPFTPEADPSGWTAETRPVITFYTSDSTSGIDHYELKIDDDPFETQASPYTLPSLSDGTHTITVRAYNKAGKFIDGSVKVYIDTQKPNPIIPLATPNNWTNMQPVISFNTTDATSGIEVYQIRIDSGAFTNRTSPYTLPTLEEGQHTVTVRALDRAGNYVDGIVNVYIDLTPPEPFEVKAIPDAWTNQMPELQFSAADNLSGIDYYTVQIDSGDFILQNSPYTLPPLTDGMHIITVRAFDVAGNQRDSDVMVYIDTTSPAEFIPVATPANWTNQPPTISFISTDDISDIAHYKLRIDDGPFFIRTSPYTLPELLDGIHNITVRAYDLAGNYIDGKVQVFIDNTDPNIILNHTLTGIWHNKPSLTVSWEYSDTVSGVQKVLIQLNDQQPIDVGLNTSYELSGFTNGPQKLQVTVFDNAQNNLTRELEFNVDFSAPIIIISSPKMGEAFADQEVGITWTGLDNINGSGIDRYKIKLDENDYIDMNKKTEHVFKSLVEGKHTVTVGCMDVAGNWDYQSVTFIIDLTEPKIEFHKSVDNTSVSGSMVFINWTGDDGESEIAYYEIKLDDDEYLKIGSNTSFAFYNLSKGAHTITVRAVDFAGNAKNTTMNFEVEVDRGDIPDKKDDDNEAMNNWFLISLLIVILVVVILIIGILFFNIRKKRQKEYTPSTDYKLTEDEEEYWDGDEDMYTPERRRVYDSTSGAVKSTRRKPKRKPAPDADMEDEFEEEYPPEAEDVWEQDGEYYEPKDEMDFEDEDYEPEDEIEFDEDYAKESSEEIDGDFEIVGAVDADEDDEFEEMDEFDEE